MRGGKPFNMWINSMYKRYVFISMTSLFLLGVSGCSTTPSGSGGMDDLEVNVAEPIEMRIETKKSTKQEIMAEHGNPDREVRLNDTGSSCKERWYYDGKANLGFGPVDVAMFVDFDEEGRVCKNDQGEKE
jgi:hypothetical protein